MQSLLAVVRTMNRYQDTRAPEHWGLASTWFSPAEVSTLAQLKSEREATVFPNRVMTVEWSELELRQLLFLKGIRVLSCPDVGKELGVSARTVDRKYRKLCKLYGLLGKADEE